MRQHAFTLLLGLLWIRRMPVQLRIPQLVVRYSELVHHNTGRSWATLDGIWITPLKVAARVRIPLGLPRSTRSAALSEGLLFHSRSVCHWLPTGAVGDLDEGVDARVRRHSHREPVRRIHGILHRALAQGVSRGESGGVTSPPHVPIPTIDPRTPGELQALQAWIGAIDPELQALVRLPAMTGAGAARLSHSDGRT